MENLRKDLRLLGRFGSGLWAMQREHPLAGILALAYMALVVAALVLR